MLESFGLKVWWDKELHAGDSFEDAIDKAILDSGCVIVVWSKYSINSQWVRNEALEGMERHILVPVQFDDVRVPVAFKQLQAVNFIGWPQDFDEAESQNLIESIERKLKGVRLEAGSPGKFLTPKKSSKLSLAIGAGIGLLLVTILAYSLVTTLDPLDLIDSGVVEIDKPHPLADDPVSYRMFLQAQDRIRRSEHEDIDEAIRLLTEVTETAPDFADGYAALCQSLLTSYRDSNAASEYQQAEKACNRALFLDQNNADVFRALGDLFSQAGESDRAEAAYHKALELDPENSDAHIGLGFVQMKVGNIIDAEISFKKAVDMDPDYIRAHNALGSFFLQQGIYSQSSETYQKITRMAPTNALAWNNLGISRMLTGEFEGAFEAWRKASHLNKNSSAFSNMGYVLYLLGRFDEAAQYFSMSIENNQQDHRLWGNLGDALRFIDGSEHKMIEAYTKAITLAEANREINPEDGYLLGRLAVYYSASNNFEKAHKSIELLGKQEQNDIYILFDIAVALSIMGEQQAAIQQLELAKAAGYPSVLSDADPQFH